MIENYATIELTSFAGSIGGEHTYADIHIYIARQRIESAKVKMPMTTEYAAYLNEKDDTSCWEVGDMTQRFESEEQAIKISLKEIKSKWPFINIVMKAGSGPVRCFLAQGAYKGAYTRINDIASRFKSCYKNTNDPWASGIGAQVDAVYEEWNDYIKMLEGKL